MRTLRVSLRLRLLLLTIAALLPALAIILFNELSLRRSREAEAHALALRTGQQAALEMARIVDGLDGVLLAMTGVSAVRAFDEGPCRVYLSSIVKDLPQVESIVVTDAAGVARCRSDDAPLGSLADRPYFQEVMRTRTSIVGEFRVSRTSGRRGLPVLRPMLGSGGEVTGVLVANLSLDWLSSAVRERALASGSALTIADRKGVIVAREPFPDRFIGTRIPEPFLQLVNGDKPGTREVTSQDGTERVIGFVPTNAPPLGLYVSAGLSRDELLRPVNQATLRSAILAGLGGLAALVGAYLLGRTFVQRPVQRLVQAIQGWRSGPETARTGLGDDGSEIGAVGAAIDAMLDELAVRQAGRERAEAHRDLLMGEMNHRIKNLLATVQALAQQSFRGTARPNAALDGFLERLVVLSRSHDLLMREGGASADLVATIDAVAILHDPVRERITTSGPHLLIRAEAALSLSLMLHELCTNALKYGALSREDGRVSVTWAVDGATPPCFTLRWRESGGPPVAAPTHRGFGSRLIERGLAGELGATVDLSFEPEGVRCTLTAPAGRVLDPAAGAQDVERPERDAAPESGRTVAAEA